MAYYWVFVRQTREGYEDKKADTHSLSDACAIADLVVRQGAFSARVVDLSNAKTVHKVEQATYVMRPVQEGRMRDA